MNAKPQTMFGKLWDAHLVRPETPESPALLHMDLHLVHEATSPQAFETLRQRGLRVRRPDRTVATMDHVTPTRRDERPTNQAAEMMTQLEANCREFGVALHSLGSARQGIVHVIGPELGLTLPGKTIVCGDSHTSTHGAFGALAFGVGTSEVAHVLATQCLLRRQPRILALRATGRLNPGVTAKDLILSVIAKLGFGGATGHAIEFTGPAIQALSMEERMTVCNMSIEAGARSGLVAPDDTTFQWVYGRPFAPTGADWDRALASWRALPTDDGAAFDRTLDIDVSELEPMITWGTNPATGISLRTPVPEPADPTAVGEIRYMGLQPGRPLLGHPIDVVFIGSCTNSRLSDLQAAAKVMRGRKVAPGLRVLVVPGSQQVKRAAEAEGLDRVFRDAGAEWREAGCSMCLAMNGDHLEPGQYCVSTSNRNFEGRQGKGGRTFLASPLTAAAAAVTGRISDVRKLLPEWEL